MFYRYSHPLPVFNLKYSSWRVSFLDPDQILMVMCFVPFTVVPRDPRAAFASFSNVGGFRCGFRNSCFEKTSSLVYIAWKTYQTRKVTGMRPKTCAMWISHASKRENEGLEGTRDLLLERGSSATEEE